MFGPHVDGDGVLQRSVPLFDGGLVVRLDEQLRALTGLKLQPAETHWSTLLTFQTDTETARAGPDHHPYLDDMLLAGLVLGGPLHRAALQVHGELRLGLAASKLRGEREEENT